MTEMEGLLGCYQCYGKESEATSRRSKTLAVYKIVDREKHGSLKVLTNPPLRVHNKTSILQGRVERLALIYCR